ncbi:hypothetical protein [Bacillus cereus]|uniref:hypothetical protein n=1 Tax=Bacillus cereus TaxID=1396 RepID=UPI0018A6ECBD|nr:hypothetical protein [Bacillus cereus]MBF8118145.1 hypothetical protein [Bacillus cereus]
MIKRYDIRFNDFKKTGMDIQLEDGKILGEMSFLLDNKTASFKFSLLLEKEKTLLYFHSFSGDYPFTYDSLVFLYLIERENFFKTLRAKAKFQILFEEDSKKKEFYKEISMREDFCEFDTTDSKNKKLIKDLPSPFYMSLSNIKFDELYQPKVDELYTYISERFEKKKTAQSVENSILSFYDYVFIHRCSQINNENEQLINEFIDFELKRDIKESFLNKKISNILSFLHYKRIFIDKHKIKKCERITNELDHNEINAKIQIVLERSKEELEKVTRKEKISMISTSKLRDHYRNYHIIRLLIHTAARLEEIMDLTIDNIDLNNNLVLFPDRSVSIPEKYASELHHYIDFRKQNDLQIEFTKKSTKMDYDAKKLITEFDILKDEFLTPYERKQLYHMQQEYKAKKSFEIPEDFSYHKLCFAEFHQTFVFNNSLFVSNRYNQMFETSFQRILREKYGIVSEDLRKYAIHQLLKMHPEQQVRKILGLKTNVDIRYV